MAYYESGRDPSLPPVHESVRRKRRWGCACGCAVFLLLALFGVMGVTYWILRPQPVVPKDLVLPPKAIGFGVIRLGGDDAGIKDLTRYCLGLVEKSQSVTDGNQARAASLAMKTLQTFVGQLVQGDAALALVPAKEGSGSADESRLEVLFGFSTKNHLGTLIGQVLLRGGNGDQSVPRPYNGGVIVSGATGTKTAPVGWIRNLMLFGTEVSLLEGAVDRVVGNQSVPVDLDLQDILDQIQFSSPPAGQDLAFGMVLKPGMLQSLTRQLAKSGRSPKLDEELTSILTAAGLEWSDALGLALTGDVVNADSTRVEIRIVTARPEVAKKVLAALTKAFEGAQDTAVTPGQISFRRDMKTIGSVVSVTVTMSNIKSWIEANTALGRGATRASGTPARPSVTPSPQAEGTTTP
jgi:hypothetical protein